MNHYVQLALTVLLILAIPVLLYIIWKLIVSIRSLPPRPKLPTEPKKKEAALFKDIISQRKFYEQQKIVTFFFLLIFPSVFFISIALLFPNPTDPPPLFIFLLGPIAGVLQFIFHPSCSIPCPYCSAPFRHRTHWKCASCHHVNEKRRFNLFTKCERCQHEPNVFACPFCTEPILLTETAKTWDSALVYKNCATPHPFIGFPEPKEPPKPEPNPLVFPPKLRFEGMWVIAPPGRGKTTLLSVLFQSDLEAVKRGEATIILMDSKGDLLDNARRLKDFAPGQPLADKLCLLEPHASFPLALNPLDMGSTTAHTISLLEYVFTSLLETKPSPLQSTLFRSVLIALKAVPNATFSTFRDFLRDGWKPFRKHIEKLDPEDRNFFLNGEFDSKTYSETRQQLLWRIRDLTTKAPLLRDMFRAPKTLVDIGKEIDAGKVIIIDNSTALLTEEGSEFFSRLFIALILSAAHQRSRRADADKKPVYFYIDECQTVISRDEKVATILDQCRSQKIALILAHQRLKQIASDNVKDALANCAIRLANPDEDAAALAPRFRTKADVLTNLPKGTFAKFVRDETRIPIRVEIPDRPLEGLLKMSPDEQAEVRRTMRARYSYKPDAYPEPEAVVLKAAEPPADPFNIDTTPSEKL